MHSDKKLGSQKSVQQKFLEAGVALASLNGAANALQNAFFNADLVQQSTGHRVVVTFNLSLPSDFSIAADTASRIGFGATDCANDST